MGELVIAADESRVDATGAAALHLMRLPCLAAHTVKMMAVLDQYTQQCIYELANEANSLSAWADDCFASHTDPWPGQMTAG